MENEINTIDKVVIHKTGTYTPIAYKYIAKNATYDTLPCKKYELIKDNYWFALGGKLVFYKVWAGEKPQCNPNLDIMKMHKLYEYTGIKIHLIKEVYLEC
jgi:hypothetical protein